MTRDFGFDEVNNESKKWVKLIVDWMIQQSDGHLKSVELDKKYQKLGIDFVLEGPKKTWLIEIKVNAHKPKNFAIETASNVERQNMGWVFTSEADLVLYYFKHYDKLYIIELPKFRDWFLLNMTKYPKFQARTQGLYTTEGRLIPIKDLDFIGEPRQIRKAERHAD